MVQCYELSLQRTYYYEQQFNNRVSLHLWSTSEHTCVAPLFISNQGQKVQHKLYAAAILLRSLHTIICTFHKDVLPVNISQPHIKWRHHTL